MTYYDDYWYGSKNHKFCFPWNHKSFFGRLISEILNFFSVSITFFHCLSVIGGGWCGDDFLKVWDQVWDY